MLEFARLDRHACSSAASQSRRAAGPQPKRSAHRPYIYKGPVPKSYFCRRTSKQSHSAIESTLARKMFRGLAVAFDLARGANAQKRFDGDKPEVVRLWFRLWPRLALASRHSLLQAFCRRYQRSVLLRGRSICCPETSPDAHAVLRCLHPVRLVWFVYQPPFKLIRN